MTQETQKRTISTEEFHKELIAITGNETFNKSIPGKFEDKVWSVLSEDDDKPLLAVAIVDKSVGIYTTIEAGGEVECVSFDLTVDKSIEKVSVVLWHGGDLSIFLHVPNELLIIINPVREEDGTKSFISSAADTTFTVDSITPTNFNCDSDNLCYALMVDEHASESSQYNDEISSSIIYLSMGDDDLELLEQDKIVAFKDKVIPFMGSISIGGDPETTTSHPFIVVESEESMDFIVFGEDKSVIIGHPVVDMYAGVIGDEYKHLITSLCKFLPNVAEYIDTHPYVEPSEQEADDSQDAVSEVESEEVNDEG